jgi:hypothetical protein
MVLCLNRGKYKKLALICSVLWPVSPFFVFVLVIIIPVFFPILFLNQPLSPPILCSSRFASLRNHIKDSNKRYAEKQKTSAAQACSLLLPKFFLSSSSVLPANTLYRIPDTSRNHYSRPMLPQESDQAPPL